MNHFRLIALTQDEIAAIQKNKRSLHASKEVRWRNVVIVCDIFVHCFVSFAQGGVNCICVCTDISPPLQQQLKTRENFQGKVEYCESFSFVIKKQDTFFYVFFGNFLGLFIVLSFTITK